MRRLGGFGYVPNVQKVLIRGGGNVEVGVSSSAVQSGANVFLGVPEVGQGHSEGGSILELAKVAQNHGNNFFVFPGARMRNVPQVHRLKIRSDWVRLHCKPPALPA